MRILAKLTKSELEEIYELTYKYGWLVAIEREKGGWLPDKAYMEKARIEHELGPIIDYALDEMIETYDHWLYDHVKETWLEADQEEAETRTENPLAYIIDLFVHWQIDPENVVRDVILEYVSEGMNDEQWLLQNEDSTMLAEQYGEDFLEYLANESLTEEEGIRYLDVAESSTEEIVQFIKDNDLIEALVEYIVEEQGWTLKEYLDNHSFDELVHMYGPGVDVGVVLDEMYQLYLDKFPGLEKEIENIGNTKEDLEEAQDGSLSDRIIAFQIGLTTAHHHGIMADHLLETDQGEGEKILDEISSGPKVKTWDRELRRVLT
jgi:hypothetical protein